MTIIGASSRPMRFFSTRLSGRGICFPRIQLASRPVFSPTRSPCLCTSVSFKSIPRSTISRLLPDLRSEQRDYLGSLRELDDYEAFISINFLSSASVYWQWKWNYFYSSSESTTTPTIGQWNTWLYQTCGHPEVSTKIQPLSVLLQGDPFFRYQTDIASLLTSA